MSADEIVVYVLLAAFVVFGFLFQYKASKFKDEDDK